MFALLRLTSLVCTLSVLCCLLFAVLATACREEHSGSGTQAFQETDSTESISETSVEQDVADTAFAELPKTNPPSGTSPADSSLGHWEALDWLPEQMLEPKALENTIRLDLRYAGADNFVGEQLYPCGRCLLRPAAAQALIPVQDSLRQHGLGLLLLDCYRPLSVQWRLWNKVPDRRYVADPRKGSQHNRGLAVDLTLCDLSSGAELDMGTPYDFFGVEAWHRSDRSFPEPISSRRVLLLGIMTHFGWHPTSSEWWHYSWPMRGAGIEEKGWTCP